MIRRVLVLALALAGCVVDETGYLDDDSRSETDLGVGLEDDLASKVFYSAETSLVETPVPVAFVALPDTFTETTLTLSVLGRTADAVVEVVDGGFVALADGALDDTVVFLDDAGDEVARVVLAAPLEGAPDADAGGMPPETGGDTDDGLDAGFGGFEAASGGQLPVGDGDIPGVRAPYLVYDRDLGTSARVAAGETGVTLRVQSGDTVCVASLDDLGVPGLSACSQLP